MELKPEEVKKWTKGLSLLIVPYGIETMKDGSGNNQYPVF